MEFADQKMKKYKNTKIPEMPMSKLKKKKKKTRQVPKCHCVEHLWLGPSLLNSRLISNKKQEQKYLLPLFLHIWKTPTKTKEDTSRHIIAGDYFQSLILSWKIL